jgi:hypothetical protein|tara:strand:+ start:2399 stop:2686 length:288 start_codon:yes stop_codon:yes gene_type:complete
MAAKERLDRIKKKHDTIAEAIVSLALCKNAWPIWTTHAIIDALIYTQCLIVGSGHVGNYDNHRASNMRLLPALDHLADWRNAAFASAVSGWDKRR